MDSPLVLRVLRVPGDSSLPVGTAYLVPDGDVVLGRAPDCDVVIDDLSVSRRHLRIARGPGIVLDALTEANGSFVDGRRISGPTPLGDGAARIQLGGVVLELSPLPRTQPVFDAVDTTEASSGEPLFALTWDAGQCSVRCGGRDLGLSGAPARFFGLLAEQAGSVVHHWDLQEALGTVHLAPLACSVRDAIQAAVAAGALDPGVLRERLRAAAIDLEGDDAQDPVRALVRARRGHGYVLQLLASDVEVHST